MEQIKITNHQFFSLIALYSIGGSIIVISATAAGIANHDAWLSALLLPVYSVPLLWLYWFLGSRHPGMTLIGIVNKILGKWIGLIPSVGVIFFCFLVTGHVINDIGKFIAIEAMPETPEYVIDAVFMIVIVIAVLYGIETIARSSELFLYFVAILFLAAMILVLPNIRIENLQPVLENGIIPVFKGSLVLANISLFPMFLVLMIYPSVFPDIAKARVTLFKGFLFAALLATIAVIVPVLVLGGKMTASFQFPSFYLAKEINVGVIFTRLEFIIALTWIVTQYYAGLIYFYSCVTALSELLGLSDHKRIAVPMGFIISTISDVALPDGIYHLTWHTLAWPPFIMTFAVVLPIVLLIVFFIKKWVADQG